MRVRGSDSTVLSSQFLYHFMYQVNGLWGISLLSSHDKWWASMLSTVFPAPNTPALLFRGRMHGQMCCASNERLFSYFISLLLPDAKLKSIPACSRSYNPWRYLLLNFCFSLLVFPLSLSLSPSLIYENLNSWCYKPSLKKYRCGKR